GVSFSHGANDGQKGIGLIMLVLIGVTPAGFVLNMNANGYNITRTYDAMVHLQHYYEEHKSAVKYIINMSSRYKSELKILDEKFHCDNSRPITVLKQTSLMLANIQNYSALKPEQRNQMRRLLMCLSDTALDVAKLSETSSSD
ncbi:MAG: anion permease, partial [Arsenophonus sp. NC-QC1-MAG3]